MARLYILVFGEVEIVPFSAQFNEAGYSSTNFGLESGDLFIVAPLFVVIMLMRRSCNFLTRNSKENKCTRFLRKPVDYRIIVVRYMLEGCFGLGLAALVDIYYAIDNSNWRKSTVTGLLTLISLIITTFYLLYASRQLSKLMKETENNQ